MQRYTFFINGEWYAPSFGDGQGAYWRGEVRRTEQKDVFTAKRF